MHHQTSRIQGRAGTKQRMTACIDALGLLSSMTTGQHGNEKHGHQKGNQQRRHDSQPQIAKNLPSHSLHKHHRKEDANGCQSRCNDSPSDFPGPPHGSHAHVISFLTTSINGLQDHDGRIHQHTNPHGQAAERHDVQGNFKHVERCEGHRNRNRNAHGNNERGSKISKE